jgi:hypothetical protein
MFFPLVQSANPLILNHCSTQPIFHTTQPITIAQILFATLTAKIIFTNHTQAEAPLAFRPQVAEQVNVVCN